MSQVINSFYHDVDNGGIEINIICDQYDNISIEMQTQYFGYPSVSSTLFLGSESNSDVLMAIGKLFNDAAVKLNETT